MNTVTTDADLVEAMGLDGTAVNNVADLVRDLPEGLIPRGDDLDEVVRSLVEAGASTELRRIAAAIGGLRLVPESWQVTFEASCLEDLPGGGCPQAKRLTMRVSASGTRTWSTRWFRLEGLFAIRRTTGGNFHLVGDQVEEDEEEELITNMVVSTGKSAEEVHTYLLRFAGDGQTPVLNGPGGAVQAIAEAIVQELLRAYALQQLLTIPEFGG